MGSGTAVLVADTPRFQEMISRRVEVIANGAESAELIDRIQYEMIGIAPQLLEALQDAESHGAPAPTFTHEGMVYTVYAARIHYLSKRAQPQTVLAVERELPEARLLATSSSSYRRKLLLLQRLEPRPRRLRGFYKPYSWWDVDKSFLSCHESENIVLAPDDLLTAFAENAEGIFEQLVTKSREKVARAENGLRALTSLGERIS